MERNLAIFLKYLESKANSDEEKILWPDTPVEKDNDLQEQIFNSCGVRDVDAFNKKSRTYKISKAILQICEKEGGESISIIDICCGDGLVLLGLKKRFPLLKAYGLDLNKGVFSSHKECEENGVEIYKGYIQDLFNSENANRFLTDNGTVDRIDLAIMLNTYRSWETAILRDDEKDLPALAERFFKDYCKYIVLTATGRQIIGFIKNGFNVKVLGRGERTSIMCLLESNCKQNVTNLCVWGGVIIYLIWYFIRHFLDRAKYYLTRGVYYLRILVGDKTAKEQLKRAIKRRMHRG